VSACKGGRAGRPTYWDGQDARPPLEEATGKMPVLRWLCDGVTSVSMFFDPYEEKETYRRKMPHWLQSERLCFVTFRLADSIPRDRVAALRSQRESWLRINQPPYTEGQWIEYHKLFSERVNRWLDECTGSCLLADERCAAFVADAMSYFAGTRYRLDHWVIMPNHVHVLVLPMEAYDLMGILQSWKSFTAKQINKLVGRDGALWQSESFDYIVRSPVQLEKFRNYIVENASSCSGRSRLSTQRLDEAL
jgi:REP element-mobilizing transposase RayT